MMVRIALCDDEQSILDAVSAHVDNAPNGDKMLRNEKFQILGYYNKQLNVTKDARFMIVGRGDILTSLLR